MSENDTKKWQESPGGKHGDHLPCRISLLHLWTVGADDVCATASSVSMQDTSITLPGLSARLDKICHHQGAPGLPPDKPHAFVYFITITNQSEHTVTLVGRKWIIDHADGSRQIIEGDKIVGEVPRLAPGESFSYNSCHMTAVEGVARGCYHGVDDMGRHIRVPLPAFSLRIPSHPTFRTPA